MITQMVQTMCPQHWRVCRTSVARIATALRSGRSIVMPLVALAFVLSSCAEFQEFLAPPTDNTRLHSDLQTQQEALAKLASRVDDLERQGSVMGQSPQDLTRAIEVLLKKALETEARLDAVESAVVAAKTAEKPAKPARQPIAQAKTPTPAKPSDHNGGSQPTQATSSASKKSVPEAKTIRLGMTSEEVRRALGDPISTETSQSYIFWHYSQVTHQKYVIFEKETGQVSGWWGL